MQNLRNRINVTLVNNKKYYSNCTAKQTYMSHKICWNMYFGTEESINVQIPLWLHLKEN